MGNLKLAIQDFKTELSLEGNLEKERVRGFLIAALFQSKDFDDAKNGKKTLHLFHLVRIVVLLHCFEVKSAANQAIWLLIHIEWYSYIQELEHINADELIKGGDEFCSLGEYQKAFCFYDTAIVSII